MGFELVEQTTYAMQKVGMRGQTGFELVEQTIHVIQRAMSI